MATVEPVVRGRLDEVRNGSDHELEQMMPVEGVLRIELAGSGKEPSAYQLVERLIEATDSSTPDGEWRHPMAAAKAIAALGPRVAHHGDIDAAVAHGHQALDIPRQSIPSLVSTTVDLMEALVPARRNAGVVELRDRIAELSAA